MKVGVPALTLTQGRDDQHAPLVAHPVHDTADQSGLAAPVGARSAVGSGGDSWRPGATVGVVVQVSLPWSLRTSRCLLYSV